MDLGIASKLRSLSLTFIIVGSVGQNDKLPWLVRNLTGPRPSISIHLEELVITILLLKKHPVEFSVENICNHRVWVDLDSALGAQRYSKLRSVKFLIMVEVYGTGGSNLLLRLPEGLAQRMPLLNDKHVLAVEATLP
jgi:hypothetical protein